MCCKMVAMVGWWWVELVEWWWVDGWSAVQMKRKIVWDEEEEERRMERERVLLWERIKYDKIMICKAIVNNHVNMLGYCSKFGFYPIIYCLMCVSYRLYCVNFCSFFHFALINVSALTCIPFLGWQYFTRLVNSNLRQI